MKTRMISLLLLLSSSTWAGDFADYNTLGPHLFSGNSPDGIPAMTNPQFTAPDQVTYVLEDDLVMGVYINGVAKAYPENLGWWHEIINDEVGGQFISVTFCPLTGTAQVFNATDSGGGQIKYGVSGSLINSNLVMYRREDQLFEVGATLFPQMIYTGLNGRYEGEVLELLPVVETTWAMWKKLHPDTQVAQWGTGLEDYRDSQQERYTDERRYQSYPYISRDEDYRVSDSYLIFRPTTAQPRPIFGTKAVVLGICREGDVKSFAFERMGDTAVINDVVGLTPLVILFDAASKTALPYHALVDGQSLSFYQVEPQGELPVEMVDFETGSRWNMLGQALAGPLAGAQLEQVPAFNSMWFAWDTYYNGSPIWDGEGILEPPTAVEEVALDSRPQDFGLDQNVPNPFNPTTHIDFSLERDQTITLSVYNLAGQTQAVLAEGFRPAGTYRVIWDGTDQAGQAVASGVYLYRLNTGTQTLTKTMTLLK